jgi:hypothetical protein
MKTAEELLGEGLSAQEVVRVLNSRKAASAESPEAIGLRVSEMSAKLLEGRSPYKAPSRNTRMTLIQGVEPRYTPTPPDQIVRNVERLWPQVAEWTSDRNPAWPGFIFYGGLGNGKTGTAVEICRRVFVERSWGVRVEKLWRILARMKACYGDDRSEVETVLVEEYCLPEVLVVDEVGVNPGTLSDHRIIYQVLDTRYERLKPTVLTTNHDIDTEEGRQAFLACFGSRTADRFTGCQVRFDGANLRQA